MTSLKAVLYARVSSETQEQQGTIELQLETAARWAKREGVELVARYLDEDVSGVIPWPERASASRLLSEAPDLVKVGVSLVVFYDWSRVGREPFVIFQATHLIEKSIGLRMKSLTETADSSSPESVLLLCVSAGLAHMERERMLRRMREAVNVYARQGIWGGGLPPYGYRVVGLRKEARLQLDTDPLPGVDPAFGFTPVSLVEQVFVWASERVTLSRICERLNSLNAPTSFRATDRIGRGHRATHWQPARVHGMLRNPVYRGEHHFGRFPKPGSKRPPEIIVREVPAIVSAELWTAAQEGLQINRRNSGRNQGALYLLKGLVRCGACGRLYIGRKKDGRPLYYCNGNHRNGNPDGAPCHAPVLAAEPLETTVWARVERLIRNPGETLQQLHAERLKGQEGSGRIAAQLTRLEEALTARERQRQQIITWARSGLITEIEMAGQLQAIRAEEEGLRRQVEELRPQVRSAAEAQRELETAEALIRQLGERLGEVESEESKREYLLALVREVVVDVEPDSRPRVAIPHVHWRFFRA